MMQFVKDVVRFCCLLVGHKRLYRVSRFLMRAARGDVQNDLRSNGERLVQTVAIRTAASPATVFDVGANVGKWTSAALEISETLRIPIKVTAFEPCRGTFAELSKVALDWTNVTLVNKACSRTTGTAIMHVYGVGLGINSLVEPTDYRETVSEEVQLITIDSYCEANEVKVIDLLKVDAEGFDFEVISGASGMLGRKAIRILQFEYNHRWIGARNYLRDAFMLLNSRGYVIGKLIGSQVEFYRYWQWELENYAEGNYVACFESDMPNFHPRQPEWLSFQLDTYKCEQYVNGNTVAQCNDSKV